MPLTAGMRLHLKAYFQEDADEDDDDGATHRSASEVEIEEEIESDQMWNSSSSDR